MFDVIERLKSDWTDKYVIIDSPAPELARFANATGVVKTVNMNGRCLVEFDQFNNVGWYDIDPSALKVVSQPRPKPVEKEAAKPSPAAKAAAPAAPKPAAGRPSTADILAKARGKAAAPAAAQPPSSAAGARPSTAEILAKARAAKAAAAPAEQPTAEAAPPAEPPASRPAAAKPAAGGPLPTTTADKIAWCRRTDGNG